MFVKIIMFIFGIYLCSISLTFMIIYLNLLYQGYNILEYVNFIIGKNTPSATLEREDEILKPSTSLSYPNIDF